MDSRIPDVIRPQLQAYVQEINTTLPDLMAGFYLQGSIALGAFNEHSSDIDFVTLLKRPYTERDIEALRSVHQTIAEKYPRWPMQGVYLQQDDLCKPDSSVALFPSYHDGNLTVSIDFDSDLVARWILKRHGITVVGDDIQAMNIVADWADLIERMVHNLNTYWLSFTKNPRRIVWMYMDDGLQWAVLGVLRQYYSFRENDITSKLGAGKYAMEHVPERWRNLIQDAINIREQSDVRLYNSKVVRTLDAIRFLRYIIRTCNEKRPM